MGGNKLAVSLHTVEHRYCTHPSLSIAVRHSSLTVFLSDDVIECALNRIRYRREISRACLGKSVSCLTAATVLAAFVLQLDGDPLQTVAPSAPPVLRWEEFPWQPGAHAAAAGHLPES